MDYELAKKLKEAGFPQAKWATPLNTAWRFDRGNEGEMVFLPSISELMEACGDKFLSIEYVVDGGLDNKEKLWWAVSRRSVVPEEYQVAGETPEEAVANLWLLLNKKNE